MYIHNLCKILFKKETNPTITKTFLTVKTTNQILIRDNCVRICCANHYTMLPFVLILSWKYLLWIFWKSKKILNRIGLKDGEIETELKKVGLYFAETSPEATSFHPYVDNSLISIISIERAWRLNEEFCDHGGPWRTSSWIEEASRLSSVPTPGK